MEIPLDSWRDRRQVRVLTRGNVDGIVAAALVLSQAPDARVDFVTNSNLAVQALRRDLSSQEFYVVDLGLTPEFARTLSQKCRQGAKVVYLDHHEQSLDHVKRLPGEMTTRIEPGVSAAGVTAHHLGVQQLDHLVALAELVEYCNGDGLERSMRRFGEKRLQDEARMIDFAWRLKVGDDRFRLTAARRFAQGEWPSEVDSVRRRYLQMVNEKRWERSLDRVRSHVRVRGEVALLEFGRHKPSLFGFGSRALSAVAREAECRLALLVQRRDQVASISARLLTPPEEGGVASDLPAYDRSSIAGARPDLGRFLYEFTQQYGIAGGGHPDSAGGRIPRRHLPAFLEEARAMA